MKNYLALKQRGDQLRRLSTVDGLTGVSNRRAFDIALDREWSRTDRSGYSLALLICDIDHFKGYNDAFGHVAGEGCLQRVASELARHARRPSDLLARYGGEEFALLLPGCALADARAIGEGVRRGVTALDIAHLDIDLQGLGEPAQRSLQSNAVLCPCVVSQAARCVFQRSWTPVSV